jgi:hypothetical protein
MSSAPLHFGHRALLYANEVGHFYLGDVAAFVQRLKLHFQQHGLGSGSFLLYAATLSNSSTWAPNKVSSQYCKTCLARKMVSAQAVK